MAKKYSVNSLLCGKCKEGKIDVLTKFDREFTSVEIKKCSNSKCKHQYYIKQLTSYPLEQYVELSNK